MKLSEGIEQAIHCVSMLASMPEGGLLSAAALARFHGVSQSYLLKHLQAMSKAGILKTVSGPKGGYALARPASQITLLHIVLAVEGAQPAFRCQEIRQNGPNPLPEGSFSKPCLINVAMLRAEQAYRRELGAVTIASLMHQLAQEDEDGAIEARGCSFLEHNMRFSGDKRRTTTMRKETS